MFATASTLSMPYADLNTDVRTATRSMVVLTSTHVTNNRNNLFDLVSAKDELEKS